MGKHSKHVVRSYRGRHRAPTHAGRNAARVATAGAIAAFPVSVAIPAHAAGTGLTAEQFDRVAVTRSGFDHDAIIACESGGDPRAQNSSSTASGLYQFINGTWKAYGGSTARARDASVAEQRRVAERAFAAEGYAPWNASKSCWSGKIGAGVDVSIKDTSARDTDTDTDDAPAPVEREKRAPSVEKRAPSVEKRAPVVEKRTPVKRESSQRYSSTSSRYTVAPGDTLSEISVSVTGSANWSDLYSYNRDVVGDNPHLIIPGQVLTIAGR